MIPLGCGDLKGVAMVSPVWQMLSRVEFVLVVLDDVVLDDVQLVHLLPIR